MGGTVVYNDKKRKGVTLIELIVFNNLFGHNLFNFIGFIVWQQNF